MNKEKKYTILIIAGLLIILTLITALLLFLYYNSNKKNSLAVNQLRELAIEKNWGVADEIPSCDKNKKACVDKSSKLILNGIKLSAKYISFDPELLESQTEKIDNSIKASRFTDTYKIASNLVEKYDLLYSSAWTKNESDFKAINKVAIASSQLSEKNVFVANYIIRPPFAKASLFIDSGDNIDFGIVYLKKVNGAWSVVLGPGSSYSDAELKAAGLDGQSFQSDEDSANIPVFYDPKNPPPGHLTSISKYIEGDQAQEATSFLTELPFSSENNKFTIDYLVNKDNLDEITYVVKIYYQDKNQISLIKKEAETWLERKGIDSKNSVQYEEFLTSSGEGL
jgi:hypothetical protein